MELTLGQALKRGIKAHKAGRVQEADQYYTANLKHGKYTKDKLEAQRYAAQVGRRVLAELKRIEQYLTTPSF